MSLNWGKNMNIDAILMFNFSDCRALGCQINFCCVIDRLLLATASN